MTTTDADNRIPAIRAVIQEIRVRAILDRAPCTCEPDCCLGEGDPPNRCEHCATIDGELPCPIADADPEVTS